MLETLMTYFFSALFIAFMIFIWRGPKSMRQPPTEVAQEDVEPVENQ